MFDTQSSSKSRLKNDTLGNDALSALYNAFASMSDTDFEKFCIETVQAGGGNQPTKDKITEAIRTTRVKATKLKKAQDFILAGMGLGV